MKILLTGSAGFLGSHVLKRLRGDGHEVFCFSRCSQVDFSVKLPFDVIVNCAGQLDDPNKMMDDNVELTLILLGYVQYCMAKRLIQIGSSAETGPMEGPRSETTFCQPSNLYEATKLAATNLCLGYSNEYDLDIVVARPFTLYGPNDKSRKMLLTLWNAFCGHKSFKCGLGGHDWIHVDDFVEGIVTLLHAPREKTKGQIYHFGTGVNTSNDEIVRLFEESVGSKMTVERTDRIRNWDVIDWRADWSKAQSQLGWSPKITVAAGIKKFVDEQWFGEDKG